MALTKKKAQRGGWQHQAEHLALSHTAVASAAMAAAEQARQQRFSKPVSCHFQAPTTGHGLETNEIKLANEPAPYYAESADLDRQVAREGAERRTLNPRRETLAARALRTATAEKRMTDLEGKLHSAHEWFILQENENHSLRTSLDLLASENSRLNLAAADQIEQMKAALTAAVAERDDLALAVCEVNEKRKAETNRLNTLLSTANMELELLVNSLKSKEDQVQQLEQGRIKLIDDTNKLLKTCKMRDTDLARAEERIGLLTELFAQLETKAGSAKKQEKETNSIPSHAGNMLGATSPKVTARRGVKISLYERELDNDEWLLCR